MKKVYRQLLLFISIITFILVAPIVILYGIGYRAQLASIDPLPVGVIIIESEPRGAEVIVNQKSYGLTPEAVSNLPPEIAAVEVKLAGYETWRKNVSVESGKAIELRDIRLFPTIPETRELLPAVTQFSLAPNRQLIAALVNKDLVVLDHAGQEIGPKVSLRSPLLSLLWSPNSSSILLADNKKNYFLVDVAHPNVVQPVPALLAVSEVTWDPRVPGRLLYIDRQQNLRALNVQDNRSQLLSADVRKFATSSRHIFALTGDGSIMQFTLYGDLISRAVAAPSGQIKNMLVTPAGKIAYEMEDGSLWYIDEQNQPQVVSAGSLAAGWSPDGRMLYVQSDVNTLHVFNAFEERSPIPQRQLHLVTRLSRSIASPQWFAGGRHLLYQVGDELLITEIDTRDHPITYQAATTNTGSSQAAVGENGETLYHLTKKDGQTFLQQTIFLVDPI